MAKRAAANGKRVIDPFFPVPSEVEDWEYNEDAQLGESDDVVEGEAVEQDDMPDEKGILQAPGTLTVVSQTIRQKANGSQVVDMVIEFETIRAADDYDVRVTKID